MNLSLQTQMTGYRFSFPLPGIRLTGDFSGKRQAKRPSVDRLRDAIAFGIVKWVSEEARCFDLDGKRYRVTEYDCTRIHPKDITINEVKFLGFVDELRPDDYTGASRIPDNAVAGWADW